MAVHVHFIKKIARPQPSFHKFLIRRPVFHQKDVDCRFQIYRRIEEFLDFFQKKSSIHERVGYMPNNHKAKNRNHRDSSSSPLFSFNYIHKRRNELILSNNSNLISDQTTRKIQLILWLALYILRRWQYGSKSANTYLQDHK